MLIPLTGKKRPKHALMVRQNVIQIPEDLRHERLPLSFGHYLVWGAQYWRNIDLKANLVTTIQTVNAPYIFYGLKIINVV